MSARIPYYVHYLALEHRVAEVSAVDRDEAREEFKRLLPDFKHSYVQRITTKSPEQEEEHARLER